MPSMNQNMLCIKSDEVLLEAYSILFSHLVFMGPNITTASKQKNILGNPKQGFLSVHRNGGFVGHNKVRISLTKDGFYSKGWNLNVRTEPEELFKMQSADMNAKSGEVVASLDLKPYLEVDAQEEGVTELFQLDALSLFQLPFFTALLKQLPMCIQESLSNQFDEELLQETLQISSKSKNLAPIDLPSKAKTIEFDENLEKLAKKAISSTSITAETQTAVDLPEEISAKSVQSCRVCSEPIWKKKFFDERRFGILEKCMCVFCYGCLRKLTCTTDSVVKGPVECPTCTTVSDNVASSSNWIKDEDKEQFFKDYCKNMQNTGIKMRLGWTSFPKRKENVWTRAL